MRVGTKRFALCIGNDNYTHMQKLDSAINDAKAIAEKLQNLGFDVSVSTDTDLLTLIEVLSELEQKVKEYDAILVFYAGHGFQIAGENLIAPIDFNPNVSPAQAQYCAYRMNDLMNVIGGNAEKTKIIILDACREIYKTRGFSGIDIVNLSTPQGTLIAFSTSPGQIAKEGDNHGKYTEVLLKYIDLPHEPIESIFKRVRTDLVKETCGSQTPWEHTSLIGDFYLCSSGFDYYDDKTYKESTFVFPENSVIKPLIEELREYHLEDQNHAINQIAFLDFSECTSDEAFILGRYIYLAADGDNYSAACFIKKFDEKSNIPDRIKAHILNGMAYEIFFDHNDNIRKTTKDGVASKIMSLLEEKNNEYSCNFISSTLDSRKVSYFYLPGSKRILLITVKLKRVENRKVSVRYSDGLTVEHDEYAVQDIMLEGESIYFDKYGNNKPFTTDYDFSYLKEEFENILTNKLIAPRGQVEVLYEDIQTNAPITITIPKEWFLALT